MLVIASPTAMRPDASGLIRASGDYISQYHEETRDAYARATAVDFEYRRDEYHRHWATSISETFDFHRRAFGTPKLDNIPETWSHAEAYAAADVHGWQVESEGPEPGLTYLGSQGNNYAYTSITFAENEERSPWVPFHVQHGFQPDESVVSAFGGCRSTAFTLGVRERYWREHVRNMLRGMDPHNAPVFVLDPITARQFIDRGGFDTKEKLIDWVYENATIPAGEYWSYQLVRNYIYPRATFGEDYEVYRSAVSRWFPRRKPWHGQS